MKIILLILLSTCAVLKAEHARRKIHTPPYPRRVPPSQQFMKKWHQPPRAPIRSRPMSSIPVHMPPGHKISMGIPPQMSSRPIAPPIRTFWKNPQQPKPKYPVQEKPFLKSQILPDKPFLTAPSLAIQDFDYQIQTNNIPNMHIKPIKQVGEKGPIHTIPAPNLSLRDKPIIVEEVRQDLSYQQNLPYPNADRHQYQVTEQPEPNLRTKLFEDQRVLQQQFQQQQKIEQQRQQIHQQQMFQQLDQRQIQQLQQQGQVIDIQLQPQDVKISPQQLFLTADSSISAQQPQKPNEVYLNDNLNPNELYQILGAAYPQGIVPEISQQQISMPNYQAVYTESLFQPEQTFDLKDLKASSPGNVGKSIYQQNGHLEQKNLGSPHVDKTVFREEKIPNLKTVIGKSVFQPEFHSFNYDEQAHQANRKKFGKKGESSLVTAGYNLDSDSSESEGLRQPELIQGYFDSRSDVERNDVDTDVKPVIEEQEIQTEQTEKNLFGTSLYSSLPNKEAAERLAKLQAAGKINNNLMEMSQKSDLTKIYITETVNASKEEDNVNQNNNDNAKEQVVEYEEYPQDESENASEEEHLEFGHKIHSKKGVQ